MLNAETLHALTHATLGLHEARNLDELCNRTNNAIQRIIPCDWPVVSLATTLLPSVHHLYSPNRVELLRIADRAHIDSHEDPVYTARLRLTHNAPASVTSMIEQHRLERSKEYNAVWKPMGVRRILRYVSPGLLGFGVEVARCTDREFTNDEAAILHAIGLHLDAAAVALVGKHNGSIPVREGELFPVQTFAWIVCDKEGIVLRSEPEARTRMRAAIGPGESLERIPAAWLRELRSRARGEKPNTFWHTYNAQLMSVHIAPIRPTNNEFSVGFLVHPKQADPLAPLRTLGLTARQAEVLHWIGQGRTNQQIGEILGVSALTVKKHLESVYHIIGAENRTSAAVIALEAQRSGRMRCTGRNRPY